MERDSSPLWGERILRVHETAVLLPLQRVSAKRNSSRDETRRVRFYLPTFPAMRRMYVQSAPFFSMP